MGGYAALEVPGIWYVPEGETGLEVEEYAGLEAEKEAGLKEGQAWRAEVLH